LNDDRLRTAFTDLRNFEAAHAPRFDPEARKRAAPSVMPKLAFAMLLVIAVAFLLMPARKPQPSLESWKAPTDFLLATPGRELLGTTPQLRGTYR
jgi:hypothetical protein